MTLANLVTGEQVFLDANTLIYHFSPHPVFGPACSLLVQRIENQDLFGFTSTHVLTEMAHRLMMIEASTLPGWPKVKVKQRLMKQPNSLQNLTRFRSAVESVLNSRIQVLTVAPPLVLKAADLSRQTGLLSSDALLVAVLQHHGLSNLASGDTDFDRVPGFNRYAPA